jgi:hypothetical protein
MAQQNDDVLNDDPKNTTETGSNAPHGDGTVSDEDVNSIGQANKEGKPIGQDHSLEDYEKSEPTSGIGAIQDYSDTSTDIAHIED